LSVSTKEDKLSQVFLNWQIIALNNAIYKLGRGTAQKNLDTKAFGDLGIVYPPLSEQKRIVERLDSAFAKIDALKANAKKQLDDAKALFQKALEKAMEPKEGWEENTIGNLFKTYAGGTPLKSGKNYYDGGTIPWIRSGEVCQKYINDCELYITEDGMKNSSAKYYPINTILVAMYGATAAQVGILKFEATSNQAVCGILPRKDFIPEYIYYWFVNIQKELASQAQGGAQPNLSQVKIKKVLLSYPPLPEQQAIVAQLDQLSEKVKKLEEIQEKTIKECDALKQAILREVFE
jgi:type I restriction enzyme S subunit